MHALQEAYRHPRTGRAGRLAARLINSRRVARLRQAVFSRLPFPVLESAVADVVYLTWLVDAATAQALAGPGVRLWQRGGRTPFTVLTYRHGHFGPSLFGPLRAVFPSPLQSNWRFYVEDGSDPALPPRTVYFVKNVMDSRLYAFATRLFSDIMQTHLAGDFVHAGGADGWRTAIAPGTGSGPALAVRAHPGERMLPPGFAALFGGWDAAVAWLSRQDAAVAAAGRQGRMALAHIDLPIPLDEVQPLAVASADCSLLAGPGAASAPLAFRVPRVRFRVLSERLLRALPATGDDPTL